MSRLSGIPLIELFAITDTINLVLPKSVSDFLERFVVGHAASSSDAAIFHTGARQSIATAFEEIPTEFNIGIGRLSLPLINTGIPFQLAFQRKAASGTNNLEGSSDVWRLDLSLEVFNLTVDFLQPAIYVPESGTTPRHLVRDPSRREVRITGSAVLRIEQPAAGAAVAVRFVDQPDPLDPGAVRGAMAKLTCSPPHFFIGGSEFGLSVGRLTFDFSEGFSPPEIIERNQGPSSVATKRILLDRRKLEGVAMSTLDRRGKSFTTEISSPPIRGPKSPFAAYPNNDRWCSNKRCRIDKGSLSSGQFGPSAHTSLVLAPSGPPSTASVFGA